MTWNDEQGSQYYHIQYQYRLLEMLNKNQTSWNSNSEQQHNAPIKVMTTAIWSTRNIIENY